jgi:dipeptidyl aminopeptidase/acylaminoacyl peptidase
MRAVVCPRLVWGTLAVLAFSSPARAQPLPTLTPADYARWESIGATELSPDGRWIAYTISRVDGDDELRYRAVAEDSTHVVPYAYRPTFSPDGRWLAYGVGVSRQARESAEKAGQPVRSKVGIVNLRTGAATTLDNIASFEFSGDSRYLAMRAFAPQGRTTKGADVIVRHLVDGAVINFGNVGMFRWQETGSLLAMTIDAEHRAGNGVRLYDAGTGVLRTLVSDTLEFVALAWRSKADDLVVMRVHNDAAYEDPTHAILVWRGVAGRRTTQATFDPAVRRGFPDGHRLVDAREPRWSEDGRTIFFGIRERTQVPGRAAPAAVSDSAAAPDSISPGGVVPAGVMPADTTAAARARGNALPEEPAGVEVWHSADVDIIPEQKVRANLDRSRHMLVAWHVDSDAFVQISDDPLQDVTTAEARMAVVLDGRRYGQDRMFGPVYRDMYTVDLQTGERTRAVERVQFQYGPSPAGRYLLYVRDGHYWTYDARTGRHVNITKDVPTSFINLDNDHTIEEKPPFGTGGWTRDDRSVLLYDRYDIWEVMPDGSRATNLTNGAAERVRHRRMWLNPEDRVVDMSAPVYLSIYGEWTKQHGYARLRPNAAPERLLFVDRLVSRLGRARDADVYYYRVEGFDESPNWYVGGPRLADARKVTATNPFQREYAWGRSELVNFRNTHGQELQAALHYPANYEPGRQYPMIVYHYEITSNQLHNYVVPSETSPYNATVFTQNGYFVLRPDIVYRGRDPGVSAMEAIVPAVQQVLATGMVDAGRVGIAGHSWGGYQTAFAVTQTDMFRAAVAGAPLTNLISMYLSVYWNTGSTDARIFEIQQGRMEVPFWQDTESYIRNSPVFHIENMNTPLLVAFGNKDGAVEFNQGVELYNAARRAGKDMVLLVYEGENHSLARRPNQLDYHRRIQQWFGHYLKGEPAPEWMTQGVNHVARQRELELIRRGDSTQH